MALLAISSLNWAHRHKRRFEAIISIQDPDARRGLMIMGGPPPERLILRFVDMDEAWPEPVSRAQANRLAEEADLQAALDFGRGRESLLVHCQAGVGRSTAIMLAILAERHGPGREQDSLSEVLRLAPDASPNLRVVRLADSLLDRSGALQALVEAHTAASPRVQQRRLMNRSAHLQNAGYPESEWKPLREAAFRIK